MPTPNQLRDLTITEVSLVDAGANPGARVVLFKRAGGPDPVSPSPTLDATLQALEGDLVTLVEKVPPARQRAEIEAIVRELGAILAPLVTPAQAIVAAKALEAEPDRFLDLAKRLVRGEASTLTRASIYGEMRSRAEGLRQAGETRQQALARFVETDPGRTMLKAHKLAEGQDEDARPVAPAPAIPTTLALTRLRALADEEKARHPKLTKEAAMARVMETPEGTRLYREHRGELLARRHA